VKTVLIMWASAVMVIVSFAGGVSVGMQTQKTAQSIPFVGAWIK